jgi:hypothetical protein
MKWSDFVYLFAGIIIPTYQMLDWFFGHFAKKMKKLWMKNHIDDIVYDHFKLHAAKRGHSPKSPSDCTDGECATLK